MHLTCDANDNIQLFAVLMTISAAEHTAVLVGILVATFNNWPWLPTLVLFASRAKVHYKK